MTVTQDGTPVQCSYVDGDGVQCIKDAQILLQFCMEHPFDHVAVCLEHQSKYTGYKWIQFWKD